MDNARARRALVWWVRGVMASLALLMAGIFTMLWYPRLAAVFRLLGNTATCVTMYGLLFGFLATSDRKWSDLPRKAKACFVAGGLIAIGSTISAGVSNLLNVLKHHP